MQRVKLFEMFDLLAEVMDGSDFYDADSDGLDLAIDLSQIFRVTQVTLQVYEISL